MLFKNTLVALLLACGAVAVPDGKRILGYRTVSKDEADKIRANGGKLVWDGVQRAARQIGPGIYTSPGPGDWTKKQPDNEFCVIYADANQLDGGDGVAKIWVPNFYWKFQDDDYKKVNLWDNGAPNIPEYITNFKGNNWSAEKTLRMSNIRFLMNKVQLLIPPALVDDGPLAITAECHPEIADLPDSQRINYDDFQENIGGDRVTSPTKPDPPEIFLPPVA